jgi:adenylate kinase
VCAQCGTTYDADSPPKGGWGVCDRCGGGPVVQRDDDREEAVRRRLDLYEQETAPLANRIRDGLAARSASSGVDGRRR